MEKSNSKGLKPTNDEILKVVKNKGVLSAKGILDKLDKKITLPGLMKRLKQMIRNNEISYLDLSKRLPNSLRIPKRMIREQMDIFGVNHDGRIKKYYYHLPLTAKFNKKLNDLIKGQENKEKYIRIVWEITREYGVLELYSISKEKLLSRPDIIRKALRKGYIEISSKEKIKGLRITKYEIEAIQRRLELFLEGGRTGQLVINVKNINFIRVRDKSYFFVNDELIPKEKLTKFLMKTIEFPPYTAFLISDMVRNAEAIVPPEIIDSINRVVDSTQNLFIEIIKDSQIKV